MPGTTISHSTLPPMHRIAPLLILVLTALAAPAQRLRSGSLLTAPPRTAAVRPVVPHALRPAASSILSPDTLYAAATAKRNGWIEPVLVVTPKAACGMYSAYRFTRRNAAGHWLSVECINSLGQPENGNFGTFILSGNASDRTGSTAWKQRIESVTAIRFMPDASGRTVVQERAYDAGGTLVYTYTPTPIAPRTEVGAYGDANGLMAELRDKAAYENVFSSIAPIYGTPDTTPPPLAYGTLARATSDGLGHVGSVSLLDAKGTPMANYNDAAYAAYSVDAAGHTLGFWSADAQGRRVIDNCGNCGMLYTYDAQGREATVTCMDADWRPMAFPSRNYDVQDGMVRIHYDHDASGNVISYRFTDADDRPMANAYGMARREIRRNARGQVTEQWDYDLQGRLCSGDGTGAAHIVIRYDSLGRQTDIFFNDSLDRPVTTEGYLCGKHFEYDAKGAVCLQQQFSVVDSVERVSYEERTTPRWERTQFSDLTSRVDSFDARGRQTFYGYYDENGQPADNDDGYASQLTSYVDRPGLCIKRTEHRDSKGLRTYANGYVTGETRYDSLACFIDYTTRDYAGHNMAYRQQYTAPDLATFTAQQNIDAFHTPCYGADANSMCYYGAHTNHSPDGKYNAFFGYDEWGDIAYINELNSQKRIYCSQVFRPGSAPNACYDEHGQPVTDYDALRDSLPKLLSVEITDTTGTYGAGLRSGDIILRYGGFTQPRHARPSYADFIGQWGLQAVLAAPRRKPMTVLRLDSEKGTFSLHNFQLSEGTIADKGFHAHTRFATQRLWQRVWQAVDSIADTADDNARRIISAIASGERTARPSADSVMLMLPCGSADYNYTHYARFVGAPAIIMRADLSYETDDSVTTWRWEEGDQASALSAMVDYANRISGTALTIYYSSKALRIDSLHTSTCFYTPVAYVRCDSLPAITRLRRLYNMWKAPSPEAYDLSHTDSLTLHAVYAQAELLRGNMVKEVPVRMFRALANTGYTDAYSYIAEHYLGLSPDSLPDTKDNLHKAVRWNSRAVKLGDYFGIYKLGVHQKMAGDTLQAIRTFQSVVDRRAGCAQLARRQLADLFLARGDTAAYLHTLAAYLLRLDNEDDIRRNIEKVAPFIHNSFQGRDSVWAEHPKEVAQVLTAGGVRCVYSLKDRKTAFWHFFLARHLGGNATVDGLDYSYTECHALMNVWENTQGDSLDYVFSSYLNDKLLTLTYERDDSVARRFKLRGTYFLLQLEDKEVTSLPSYKEWNDRPSYGSAPYAYLADKKGRIRRVPIVKGFFSNMHMTVVKPAERQRIVDAFHRWKAAHPEQFVPYESAE